MSLVKHKTTVKPTRNKSASSKGSEMAEEKRNVVLNKPIKNASADEFSVLKKISGYNNEELAALVGITHRTIRNKKGHDEIFNIAQTERLRKLNLLFEKGNQLFNNKDQFNQWLQKPSYGLDYSIPAELIKQPGGLDLVINELNSIKFGDTI